MNKSISNLTLITAILLLINLNLNAQITKQIIPDKGITDPHIHIFGDKAYLFGGSDNDYNAHDYSMKNWQIWSSSDLVNWNLDFTLYPKDTYMGAIDKCFATDAVERNGKYYWYVSNHVNDIGVVESNKPGGPYKDFLKRPLIPKGLTNCNQYDPTIFCDDDKLKTPYLIFGETYGGDYYIVKLNSDMVSLSEKPRKIKINGYYTLDDKNFVFKKNGLYYLICGDSYAIADNVYGPYSVAGYFFGSHNSIFEWHNQWYVASEDDYCKGCTPFFRGSSIHYLHFKSNGVPYIDPNDSYGVGEYDASRPCLQAENYFKAEGIDKTNDNQNGFYITPQRSGAYTIYSNVYGLTKNEKLSFNVSSNSDLWTIEVHESNPNGKLLGSLLIPNTKRKLKQIDCKLNNSTEKLDLCFVFKGQSEEKPLMDYFSFNPNGRNISVPFSYWDFKINAQGWKTNDNLDVDWKNEKLNLNLANSKSIKSPTLISGNMDKCKFVVVRMKNQSDCQTIAMHFSARIAERKNKSVEEWPENNKIDISIEPNSDFQDYIIDLRKVTEWKGSLNQIRLDLESDMKEGNIEIDAIELWDEQNFLFRDSFEKFKQ